MGRSGRWGGSGVTGEGGEGAAPTCPACVPRCADEFPGGPYRTLCSACAFAGPSLFPHFCESSRVVFTVYCILNKNPKRHLRSHRVERCTHGLHSRQQRALPTLHALQGGAGRYAGRARARTPVSADLYYPLRGQSGSRPGTPLTRPEQRCAPRPRWRACAGGCRALTVQYSEFTILHFFFTILDTSYIRELNYFTWSPRDRRRS